MLQSFNANILSFIFLQFLCLNHLKKIIQVNTLQQLFADRVPPFPLVGCLGPALLIITNKSLDFKKCLDGWESYLILLVVKL